MTDAERSRASPVISGFERGTRAKWQKGGLQSPPFCFLPRRPLHPVLAAAAGAAYLVTVNQRREPMFNVPPVVIATVAVLVLVHALRMLVLTDAQDMRFVLAFAFIPARYNVDLADVSSLPGGFGADLWTFFSYAFLHADLLHIGVNLAWLLPFGTALARRFGTWRYVVFMLVVAAAGAFTHLISHLGAVVPMIGASAAISGAMAAALRFIFQEGGPLGLWGRQADAAAYRIPAASLLATIRDPRFIVFLGVWLGLNLLIGLGSVPVAEQGQEIAWQAHIGGFVAGFFLFNVFDPVGSRAFDARERH